MSWPLHSITQRDLEDIVAFCYDAGSKDQGKYGTGAQLTDRLAALVEDINKRLQDKPNPLRKGKANNRFSRLPEDLKIYRDVVSLAGRPLYVYLTFRHTCEVAEHLLDLIPKDQVFKAFEVEEWNLREFPDLSAVVPIHPEEEVTVMVEVFTRGSLHHNLNTFLCLLARGFWLRPETERSPHSGASAIVYDQYLHYSRLALNT